MKHRAIICALLTAALFTVNAAHAGSKNGIYVSGAVVTGSFESDEEGVPSAGIGGVSLTPGAVPTSVKILDASATPDILVTACQENGQPEIEDLANNCASGEGDDVSFSFCSPPSGTQSLANRGFKAGNSITFFVYLADPEGDCTGSATTGELTLNW